MHLRELGHDTEVALDVGLAGRSDEDVRAYAIQHERILLTLDADFPNMLRFRLPEHRA